jgi:hypothetical protein
LVGEGVALRSAGDDAVHSSGRGLMTTGLWCWPAPADAPENTIRVALIAGGAWLDRVGRNRIVAAARRLPPLTVAGAEYDLRPAAPDTVRTVRLIMASTLTAMQLRWPRDLLHIFTYQSRTGMRTATSKIRGAEC